MPSVKISIIQIALTLSFSCPIAAQITNSPPTSLLSYLGNPLKAQVPYVVEANTAVTPLPASPTLTPITPPIHPIPPIQLAGRPIAAVQSTIDIPMVVGSAGMVPPIHRPVNSLSITGPRSGPVAPIQGPIDELFKLPGFRSAIVPDIVTYDFSYYPYAYQNLYAPTHSHTGIIQSNHAV